MSVLDPNAKIVVEENLNFIEPKRRKLVWKYWTPSLLLPVIMHPFKLGYLGWGKNLYGVQTSVTRCRACKKIIRCTPWDDEEYCFANPKCPSYDPHRDVTFLLNG